MGNAIHLHKTAPWNRSLRNTYRTRYAQVDGRYFEVEATSLDSGWTTWEISAAGDPLHCIDVAARNLAAARQRIQDRIDGLSDEEIMSRSCRAPGTPTGRSARRYARL